MYIVYLPTFGVFFGEMSTYHIHWVFGIRFCLCFLLPSLRSVEATQTVYRWSRQPLRSNYSKTTWDTWDNWEDWKGGLGDFFRTLRIFEMSGERGGQVDSCFLRNFGVLTFGGSGVSMTCMCFFWGGGDFFFTCFPGEYLLMWKRCLLDMFLGSLGSTWFWPWRFKTSCFFQKKISFKTMEEVLLWVKVMGLGKALWHDSNDRNMSSFWWHHC